VHSGKQLGVTSVEVSCRRRCWQSFFHSHSTLE